MNLLQLIHLQDSELNNLLIYHDDWQLDTERQQLFKKFNDTHIYINLNEFSPFTNSFQANLILSMSSINFSNIKTDNKVWGLCVFENKNKKNFILESQSKLKSSLLLIIAVRSGLLYK